MRFKDNQILSSVISLLLLASLVSISVEGVFHHHSISYNSFEESPLFTEKNNENDICLICLVNKDLRDNLLLQDNYSVDLDSKIPSIFISVTNLKLSELITNSERAPPIKV